METKASNYKLNNECYNESSKDKTAARDDLSKVTISTLVNYSMFKKRNKYWKYRIPVTHVGPSRIMGSSMS